MPDMADKPEEAAGQARVPFADKSRWSAKLARGEKVYTIELVPPAGITPTKLLESAKAIKHAGIDAINIPDGPRASSRLSTIITAILVEQRVGIETILHYTCRDRNLIGMQSDMLGAHAIGLRNMLLLTGDPPKLGDYPNATGVFDVDAIGLTRMVRKLNGGIDLGGRPIGEPTALSMGVGVNPVHSDFDYEMERFRRKLEAGAEWAITQPVFDLRALERFFAYMARHNLKIPVIVGIWPLTSLKNAQFMRNEVPGIEIPDEVMERMARTGTPQEGRDEGVEIARQLCAAVISEVQGVQLSAPFGRVDLALRVIGK
jgi:methionine synthase / methylenetetrahydrofolate reductase(NADPH)